MTRAATARMAVFPALMLLPSMALALGNYELWHTEGQDIRLDTKYTLALRESFRWHAGGDLYHQEYDIGMLRKLSDNWKLGLNYRQVYSKNSSDDIEDESRPQMIALWKSPLGKFNVESNNRLEYRSYEHKSSDWRYRNKATVQLPLKLGCLPLAPYVSDEIFLKLNDMTFIKNRLYSGITGAYGKVSLDLYYMHQDSKGSSGWTGTEVLGSALKIAF